MQRIQLIINDKIRLGGADKFLPGTFVIADDWNVISPIGYTFEAIALAARPKAIHINFETKEIKTDFDLNSEFSKDIVTRSAMRYDPKRGDFWGVEILCFVGNTYLPWFFCTESLRLLLARFRIHTRIAISSTEIKGRFNFWSPVIHQISEQLDNETLSPHFIAMKEFMAPFKAINDARSTQPENGR